MRRGSSAVNIISHREESRTPRNGGHGLSKFDPKDIRKDFPIFRRTVREKPLVYLDNAATTQKPREVISALERFYTYQNANIHRGIHTLSQEATEAYEKTRMLTAQFIGARSARSIVFTRNATEAINLVAYSWGREHISFGDEILLTEMEHHSNLVPWQILAREKGARLKFLPITGDGLIDSRGMRRHLSSRTKLVAVTHMSNVLGTIVQVRELTTLAHQKDTLVLIDGAQSVPHLPVNVGDIGCDFLAFSGHKMLGPMGVGVLYGREELLEEMAPFNSGGEMIREVHPDRSTWNDIPWKFEAGTPNAADVIAFGAAINYLTRIGMDRVRTHERYLIEYTLEALQGVEGLTLYGPRHPDERGGVFSFTIEGMHAHDIGTALDFEGVAVRAGHHCAQPLMRKLGVPATVRASTYIYNTDEDIDIFVDSLKKTRRFFLDVARRA